MKLPSKYQIKDYLGVLVCCCIKWEQPEGKKNISISWDDQKLYRLQTLFDLKKESVELIEILKYDISFTNNWDLNFLVDDYAKAIFNESKEHGLLSALIITSTASYKTELQFNKDLAIITQIKETFGLAQVHENAIMNIASSFGTFIQAIDSQYNS